MPAVPRKADGRLGDLLVAHGLVLAADLERTLAWQRTLAAGWPVRRLGSLLVKAGLLTMRQLTDVLSEQRGLYPFLDMPREVPPLLQTVLPLAVLLRLQAAPLYIAGRTLVVAMADPQEAAQAAELQALTSYRVHPVLLPQLQVHRLLRSFHGHRQAPAADATPRPR